MDGVRDSDISLVITWTYQFCIANKDFPFGFLGTYIHRSPSKKTVTVESSPSTSQHRQSIGFSLRNFRSRESNIKHKRCLPIATQREQDFPVFHMAKKCLCFYFDPLWSSFPTNCQSIWGRKRQFSSSGSWCYQHALGQHGWVTGWPRILWMMKSLVFDFCVLKPYKDPRGFSSLLILLMEKILHQLRLVVYPINCRVSMGFIHPRWCRISSINSMILWMMKSLVLILRSETFIRTPRGFLSLLILLMEKILHQLRLVVYSIIYRVWYIPGGCLGFLNHQQYHPPRSPGFSWKPPKKTDMAPSLKLTGIAPENRPLQWESSIPTIHF